VAVRQLRQESYVVGIRSSAVSFGPSSTPNTQTQHTCAHRFYYHFPLKPSSPSPTHSKPVLLLEETRTYHVLVNTIVAPRHPWTPSLSSFFAFHVFKPSRSTLANPHIDWFRSNQLSELCVFFLSVSQSKPTCPSDDARFSSVPTLSHAACSSAAPHHRVSDNSHEMYTLCLSACPTTCYIDCFRRHPLHHKVTICDNARIHCNYLIIPHICQTKISSLICCTKTHTRSRYTALSRYRCNPFLSLTYSAV